MTDPNAPAPIAPPTLNGTPGTPAAPGVVPPPPVDTAAPAGTNANAGGARAREFQGDDTGQVLRLLARQARINLIVSPQVTGTINMRLEDVTALKAIEVICQAQGYDLTQDKGIYYVKTPAEKASEPTQSDFYTFSYARAAQIVPLLTATLKSKATAPVVDERTNTVFYQEAKSNVSAIREFLAMVDKPTRQVMIEARLVEVNSNPVQSYGINWARRGRQFSASPKTVPLRRNTDRRTRAHDRAGADEHVQSAALRRRSRRPRPSSATRHCSALCERPTPSTAGHQQRHPGSLNPVDFLRNGNTNNFAQQLDGQPVRHSGYSLSSPPPCASSTRTPTPSSVANPRIVTADNLEATIKIVRNQPVPQLNFNEQTATAVFGGFQDKIFGNTLVR